MNELRAFPGARVPAGAGAAPATVGSVMAVAFSELQCAVWNCCSKEIQGEHRWDENINSFLGMDISYIDGILSMSVKAKIDDLFKKYPFLASGSRWSQSTSSSEIDNPPSLDDGELSDYHREIRFKIPRN